MKPPALRLGRNFKNSTGGFIFRRGALYFFGGFNCVFLALCLSYLFWCRTHARGFIASRKMGGGVTGPRRRPFFSCLILRSSRREGTRSVLGCGACAFGTVGCSKDVSHNLLPTEHNHRGAGRGGGVPLGIPSAVGSAQRSTVRKGQF